MGGGYVGAVAASEAQTGMQILEPDECRRLLAGQVIGRLGVVQGKRPVVLPVNFVLDGDDILFRTGAGTKLNAIGAGHLVCLEVDGIDVGYQSGWSVLVTGVATEVRDPGERERLEGLPLRSWVPAERPDWVRLRPVEVAGRRIPSPGDLR